MNLTDEQAHAVDLFNTSRSLKISAFAGTGKTSTLTAISKSTSKTGLYLAFNKSISDEARVRFPKSVDCKTTHSLAFRAIANTFQGNSAKLTNPVLGNHVAQLLDIEEIAVGGMSLKPRSLGFLTAKTIQRFCQSGAQVPLIEHVPLSGKLQKIDKKYQEQFKEYVSQLAMHLWDRMADPNDDAPLGHDGYLKLWSLSKPQLNYDYLLLDEAQDTNEAVLSVLRRQDSHLTLVGDRHQQIYEWRGATNAMASVETDAEAALTRSFRFGTSLAAAASSILNVLGETRQVTGNPQRDTLIAAGGRTQAILCRTNSGVIDVVIEALVEGRKPHIVGGANALIHMLEDVSKLKRGYPVESADFFGFQNWDEVVEFSCTDEGQSLKSFVGIVSTYGETVLTRKLKSVEKDEATADLTVSTGHKSKGREWDSVTLCSDFEPRPRKDDPSKNAINVEEARLLYVAVTRAKFLLVVPPRLAEKWNVPHALKTKKPGVLNLSVMAKPEKKPPPKLPEFAVVVKHVPPKSVAKLETMKPPSTTTTARQPENQASAPSLLSTIFSFFR